MRGSSIVAGLVAAHLVAAALVVVALRDAPTAGLVIGGVLLAYVWGLQHGFAADHIAAIDDATRLLIARGRPAGGRTGFAFATGHGIAVATVTAVLLVATRGAVPRAIEVGALVFIVVFLGSVCVANARLVSRIMRGEHMGPGIMARICGPRRIGRIGRARHLVPVGIVFGAASAAEVFAVVVVGQRGLTGSLVLPIALVVVFSAGLLLVDTLDSAFMARAYRWAQSDAGRRRFADLTTTALTVVVSAFVATVQLAHLVVDELDVAIPVLLPVAGLAQRFELVGAAVVVVFAVWWSAAWWVWRRRARASGAVRLPAVATARPG